MTQPPLTPTPEPRLPQSHVLSYLTAASTPTKVRKVAARALCILGILKVSLALLLVAWGIAPNVYYAWQYGWPLSDLLSEIFPWIVLSGFLAALGVAQILFARPVERGQAAACSLSVFTILPSTLAIFLFALITGIVALGNGLGLLSFQRNPFYLLFLLVTALSILALLLLIDIARYLLWIARHPITEKPPVKFLPTSTPSPAPPRERPL